MRFNRALYLKELKQYRIAFGIYVVLVVAVTVIQVTGHGMIPDFDTASRPGLPLTYWLDMGMFAILPAMLVYSWYREEYDRTTYQLLSIPVSPSTILLNRIMAFLTVAVTVQLVRILISIGTERHSLADLPVPELILGWMVISALAIHIIALSAACLVIALGQKHRRHRLLSGLVAVFATMLLMPIAALAFLVFAVIGAGKLMKYRRFRIAAIIGVVCAAGAVYYGTATGNPLVMSFVSGLFEPLAGIGFMIYSLSRFEDHVEA